jgi:two-component system, OmpR family, response regulator
MESKTILVIDDEPSIRELLSIFLSRYHLKVIGAESGQEALSALKKDPIDLILLDLMLPDIYGVDLCKQIRKHYQIPIIMLTAVQGELNTVLGFEAGADDYIEKPFNVHVLLARIRAVIKRSDTAGEAPLNPRENNTIPASPSDQFIKASFGGWHYHKQENHLEHVSGKHIFLTRTEGQLLEYFLKHAEEVLSREKIAQTLDIQAEDFESRAIDVQISRLRTKLKDKSQSNFIKSIRNKGYLLSVPVKFHT